MIGFNKALLCLRHRIEIVVAAALLLCVTACTRPSNTTVNQAELVTLRIGYGENPEVGIQQAVRNIALEGLVRIERDGRPSPWLAERWSVSPDGLTWHIALRPQATFHNGQPVTAAVVRDILLKDLRQYLGPAFDDVQAIRASAPYELEFSLKRRSTFLLEGLDVLIQDGGSLIGTGPFSVSNQLPHEAEMRANLNYYAGRPLIDRILFTSYDSVRSAWADMLRARVDMLYEVGNEAVDSLSASTQTKVFTFERPYAFLVFLNVRNPKLQDKAVRRALNFAIDRDALVVQALNSHGTPANGPIWPHHWAYNRELPGFHFQPHPVKNSGDGLRLTCLIMADQSQERIGLAIQRQLRAVGVELSFEQVSPDQFVARFQNGNFEAGLVDTRMGPSILQQLLFWHSKGPNNWGHFNSPEVDAVLGKIQTAPDDSAYKAGVAALQRAIVEDPPAIFLAWGERIRAVNTRFEVHSEAGRDILSASMLRLWRPTGRAQLTSPN